MVEPLIVDASLLQDAGHKLGGLVFPAAPAPVAAAGSDLASAAINETLPVIESPVVDGLPAVKAALTRTGSSIATAADLYAETDHALSENFNQQFNPFGLLSSDDDGSDEDEEEPADEEPKFTLPTLTDITKASAQVAKISGHISQHMNLVNQTMGSVQSLASMGQQGQAAVAPVEEAAEEAVTEEEAGIEGAAPAEAALAAVPEEAALAEATSGAAAPAEATVAGDIEGAGAGVGTEAAERAPVTLLTPEEAAGLSSAERIV